MRRPKGRSVEERSEETGQEKKEAVFQFHSIDLFTICHHGKSKPGSRGWGKKKERGHVDEIVNGFRNNKNGRRGKTREKGPGRNLGTFV